MMCGSSQCPQAPGMAESGVGARSLWDVIIVREQKSRVWCRYRVLRRGCRRRHQSPPVTDRTNAVWLCQPVSVRAERIPQTILLLFVCHSVRALCHNRE